MRGEDKVIIEIEKLEELPAPHEILEIKPGEPVRFKVVDWKLGKIVIVPRWPGAPPKKTIPCIRVYTTPKYKPTFPHYWDITPTRLVYQLGGLLTKGVEPGYLVEVTRDIPGPRAHFTVKLVPETPK